MTYLVTGGAGFIGSHLVDALLDRGHRVVVLDNFSTGRAENLAHHRGNTKLVVKRQSATVDLTPLFKEHAFDAVFHLAAITSVQESIDDPVRTHEANVQGTFNVLETARRNGVKRFIFTSSAAVYGDQETMPLTEDMEPRPLSPYALHKLIGEQYSRLYARIYDMETISLRYFNVFGPRQNPAGQYANMIPKFIRILKEGKQPTIYGDGKQTRDFVFVDDVVAANLAALETNNKECFGQVFNVGTGKSLSVNEVTSALKKIMKTEIEPIYGPSVIEPRDALADVNKAKRTLGWAPKTTFEDGLKQTVAYFASSG